MKPASLILHHIRGDLETISLLLTDEGAPLDLSPYTEITFRVESLFPVPPTVPPSALFEKTLTGGGIVVTDAVGGALDVLLEPADTSGIVMTKDTETYQWGLRLGGASGSVQSPVCGSFRLKYCGTAP